MCDESGAFLRNLPKSTFLWTIIEDSERVSTDRLMRFHSKNRGKEFTYQWEDDGSRIFKPNGIKRGQWIMMRWSDENLLLGQVIKFQYAKQTSKLKKRYTYESVIFGVNTGTEVQLAPRYLVNRSGAMIDEFSRNYTGIENYICHIRHNVLDFEESCILPRDLHHINHLSNENVQ